MQKIVYFQVEYMDDVYTGTQSIIKGSYMYKKFCIFDCYNILPSLKQEVQFDAHEFHLGLVLSLMSMADAQ